MVYTVKIFTPTPVSICQFSTHNTFIHFYISPIFFMQLYANQIILNFPLGAISIAANRPGLQSFLIFHLRVV